MSTLVQEAIDRLTQASEVEQERLARLVLAQPTHVPKRASTPYRVEAKDLGSPLLLTKDEFDVYAYGTKEEVEELDRQKDAEAEREKLEPDAV